MIERISLKNYAEFLALVGQTRWGNILLPDEYNIDVWGGVVYEDNRIVGGWVGIYRGNKRLIRMIAKSVYFDAYPTFASMEYKEKYQLLLIDKMREWAKQDRIVMFNLTHWVRGWDLPYLEKELCATFLVTLPDSEDKQWDLVDNKHRNRFRKGERNEVEVRVLKGEDAIAEMNTLQSLREQTQQHAIKKNANASMLLKSDNFFRNLFLHTDAELHIGSVDGKPATVAVMLISGETAYYHSGGSDYELNRQTGSSTYVFWKAITHYIHLPNVKYLDMGGVPVNPTPDHPAYGVYMFKSLFGGNYMEFDAGTIVINRFKYKVLSFLLRQRKLLRLFSKVL